GVPGDDHPGAGRHERERGRHRRHAGADDERRQAALQLAEGGLGRVPRRGVVAGVHRLVGPRRPLRDVRRRQHHHGVDGRARRAVGAAGGDRDGREGGVVARRHAPQRRASRPGANLVGVLTVLAGDVLADRTGGEPARVLALHGWGRTGDDFADVVAGTDALAVHLPGFGRTAPPPEAWGSVEYADHLAEALAGTGPYVVVGHSF